MIIPGEKVYLRLPENSDLEKLFLWENDSEIWETGDNKSDYTRHDIQDFINDGQDILKNKQLRLMICTSDDNAVGCIDLYNFNKSDSKAGIGILVYEKKNRRLGYATESLSLLIAYSKDELQLKQLFCKILEHNTSSLSLFKNLGFKKTGVKERVTKMNEVWINEIAMQLHLE